MAVDNVGLPRGQRDLFCEPLDRYGRPLKIGMGDAENFRRTFVSLGMDTRLANELKSTISRYVRREWNFVMVSTSDLHEATVLMLKMERAKHCLAIYNMCLAHLDFASAKVALTQPELAQLVGISSNNASVCMTQMAKAGLLCSQGRHGTGKAWYVSPASCWKGDEIARREALVQYRNMLRLEDERRRERRLRPGPRSKSDLQLDADVVNIQAGIDAKSRKSAAKKCDDFIA